MERILEIQIDRGSRSNLETSNIKRSENPNYYQPNLYWGFFGLQPLAK